MDNATRTIRYTFRLRPGKTAETRLLEEWDRCRWVWNQAVAHLHQTGEFVRDTALTAWRRDNPWLAAGSVVAQQQTLRNFRTERAKGQCRRKFKAKKRARPSLNYTLRGFSLNDGRLCLPGRVRVPVVWSRDLPAPPSSARIYQDNLGHWYVSFVVTRTDEPLPDNPDAVGFDWGVSAIATSSDPAYDLPHPEHGKQAAQRLARYQRMMARRATPRTKANTKGYERAKRRAAKTHKKIARQRQDTARKWAKKVVTNHGAIAVEDFKPRFLARSTMARKAADAAIGTTKATLIEYAERAGRKVVLVPPAYTTMTCSECDTRAKSRLLLSERIFVCASCGFTEGRDRNSARTVLNAARTVLATAGLNRAGVDAVRHSGLPSGEVRVLAEPGIPRF